VVKLERRIISEQAFIDALMELMDNAQKEYLEGMKLLSRGTEHPEFTRTVYYAHVDREGNIRELSYERFPKIPGFKREHNDESN
jgi:hypothetical protein